MTLTSPFTSTPTTALSQARSFNSTASDSYNNSSPLPDSPIPILTSVQDVREWRSKAMLQGGSVGFVPTMGALHKGHLDLVSKSLSENDLTIVSIFVNPAQFSPKEDLSSYPRTLPTDVESLSRLSTSDSSSKPSSASKTASSGDSATRKVSVIWAPKVTDMYPNGFTQIVSDQVGAFVEIVGLDKEMEGKSRPGFFRGVATVVTKLFHVVQPTLAYFGQKDIQQAIILRRLVSDLLFSHPSSSSSVRVLPTTRDPDDHLALSSRNLYLTQKARNEANILYNALEVCRKTWNQGSKNGTQEQNREFLSQVLKKGRGFLESEGKRLSELGIGFEADYISLNHPTSLKDYEELLKSREAGQEEVDLSKGAILSGAVWIWDKQVEPIKKVRLIDNFLLDFELD